MAEDDYPPIPEELVGSDDIALGWMPCDEGVYLVRAEVEQRNLCSMPYQRREATCRTVNILGNGWSQYLDWLVLRPYILREPGRALPDGIEQDSLWPEDVGQVREHVGIVQATYFPRERALCLDHFELHGGMATATNPQVPVLLQGIEGYLLRRYPRAERLVVSQDHSYVAIEGWEDYLLSNGFARVSDHPARLEKLCNIDP